MHTRTTARSVGAFAILLGVGLAATGCTPRTSGGAQLRPRSDPPSGLVIAGPRSMAMLAPVRAAISGSARTGEHIEVADPADSAEPVLASTVAPAPPSMSGPTPPSRLGPGATKYLLDQHHAQYQKYEERLSADRGALRHELSTRLRSWADSVEVTVARAPGRDRRADVRASVSQADGFFGSLSQAGVSLGTRKVLVLLATPAMAGTVTALPPSSVAGITVILANFTGSQTTQAEWQADFLQAGAARSVVLSPGAQDELAPVITQGLSGERGPAPAHVRFALNRAALSRAARARLGRLAAWLTSACPRAPVTILGFADPLGSRARNGELARQRALTTMAYLARRGVSPARMSAAGYGTGLPAAPSNSRGAQPLDRRAVIVTNPAAGQRGC